MNVGEMLLMIVMYCNGAHKDACRAERINCLKVNAQRSGKDGVTLIDKCLSNPKVIFPEPPVAPAASSIPDPKNGMPEVKKK